MASGGTQAATGSNDVENVNETQAAIDPDVVENVNETQAATGSSIVANGQKKDSKSKIDETEDEANKSSKVYYVQNPLSIAQIEHVHILSGDGDDANYFANDVGDIKKLFITYVPENNVYMNRPGLFLDHVQKCNNSVLLYYSGHGVADHIQPVQWPEFYFADILEVWGKRKDYGRKNDCFLILILDSCFAGGIIRIAHNLKVRNVLIQTSCDFTQQTELISRKSKTDSSKFKEFFVNANSKAPPKINYKSIYNPCLYYGDLKIEKKCEKFTIGEKTLTLINRATYVECEWEFAEAKRARVSKIEEEEAGLNYFKKYAQ